MTDELPHGWCDAPINEVADVFLGKTPARSEYASSGNRKVVKFRDIHDGSVDFSNAKDGFVRDNGDVPAGLRELRSGDVLITSAAHSGENIGKKCAYVPSLPDRFSRVFFTGELLNIRSSDSVLSRWIYFFFRSKEGFCEIQNAVSGVHLTGGRAQQMRIPLAPMNEQRRIVAKVERVSAKVDASRQRLDRIPILLKRFRQSILAAACSGQLTADWREENPSDQSGDDLLNRILKHRAEIWKHSVRKGTCPESPEANRTSLPDLPLSWSWIPLGILGMNPFETVQTGPFGALLHKEEFIARGVPVVAVGNLTGMGFTKEGLYFVSKAKAKQLSRFDIQAGDVLFARSGATLGKVCVAPPDAKDWRMTGHILRARLNQKFLISEFCVFALRGDPAVTRQVFGSVQGTTRPGYNTTLLESIALPVASLREQKEIVRRVEELFALADQIEARYAKAKAYVDNLTRSILAKAFRGELVPQDPNDEPASVLLERIRQQREATTTPNRKRRSPSRREKNDSLVNS